MPLRLAGRSSGRARQAALFVAVAALAVVGGCERRAGGCSTSAPTEITFAYWALAPRETITVHELVREFEAREPAVRIHMVEVTARYYEKLTTMFAAGTPPDAFAINYGRLGDFARAGLVADLRPIVARSSRLDRSQFVAAAYDSFEGVGAVVGRPGLFALPRDWGPTDLLVFNKDAFDAAGVRYPTSGWTWQQFAQACRRLTVRRGGTATDQYGAAVCLYPYAIAGWVFQNAGDFLSPDRRHSALADEKVVEAVQFIKGLVNEGVIAPPSVTQDESLEQLQRGRAAMAFATPYSLGGLRESQGLLWGIAPPLVGRRRATGCIPTGVAISARSDRKDATFRFAAYWATVGAQRVAEAGFCVPAWRPALEAHSLEKGFGPETAAVLRQAVAYARPHPISPVVPYEVMLTELKQAIEGVFAAGGAPAVPLQAAQTRIDAEAARIR
jgi:multiple sugar transport system substrate-binding protein